MYRRSLFTMVPRNCVLCCCCQWVMGDGGAGFWWFVGLFLSQFSSVRNSLSRGSPLFVSPVFFYFRRSQGYQGLGPTHPHACTDTKPIEKPLHTRPPFVRGLGREEESLRHADRKKLDPHGEEHTRTSQHREAKEKRRRQLPLFQEKERRRELSACRGE